MGNKDKGASKEGKKTAQKSLKEKRLAKKMKAGKPSRSFTTTEG